MADRDLTNDVKSLLIEVDGVADAVDPDSGETSAAFVIAATVMDRTGAGFVIVGSPNIKTTDNGYSFPTSIGIVVNAEIGFTRGVVADILDSVAKDLRIPVEELLEDTETTE